MIRYLKLQSPNGKNPLSVNLPKLFKLFILASICLSFGWLTALPIFRAAPP